MIYINFYFQELKHTMSNTDRVLLNAGSDEEDPAKFHITMKIMNVKMEDAGVYYCHANNSLGDAVSQMNLKVMLFEFQCTNSIKLS